MRAQHIGRQQVNFPLSFLLRAILIRRGVFLGASADTARRILSRVLRVWRVRTRVKIRESYVSASPRGDPRGAVRLVKRNSSPVEHLNRMYLGIRATFAP